MRKALIPFAVIGAGAVVGICLAIAWVSRDADD